MILVTRLNGSIFFINAELIQTVESTPDTIITLISKEKMVVKESAETIVERIIEYKRQVNNNRISNKENSEWT